MADFRKWLLAFAVLALIAIPAAAQGNVQPLQCVANGGVPPILRAEGLTEQVGDVVLSCTGGVPAGPGVALPQVNVQVFLSTPITSRLTSTSNAQWSAALLIVDEARPAGTQGAGSVYPTQSFCASVSGCPMVGLGANANPAVANNAYGITPGNYLGPYSGTPTNVSYNVFQGQQVATNSVAFLGVPFDAPGTLGGVRTLRITNIRTAPGAPSSSLIPQPVVEYISITGATSVPINNPQQIVGYSQYGLDQNATFVVNSQTFTICNGDNTIKDNTLQGAGAQFYLNAVEGFASAFKVRNWAQINNGSGGAGDPLTTTNLPQNLPGFIYNTETGFYMGTQAPSNVGNGAETGGLASNGTRLLFTLASPAAGSAVYVPNYVPLFQKGGTSTVTGYAVLLANADANGATGGFGSGGSLSNNLTVATASVKAAPSFLGLPFKAGAQAFVSTADLIPGSDTVHGLLPVATGVTPGLVAVPSSGVVVYEVVQTNTSALEQLNVPVVVSYGGFAPGPTTGTQATASVSFAPISPTETPATAAASTSLSIPRFIRTGGPQNTFIFNPCFCNILFPYVTTQQGYETGIAISNTSADPFGTSTSTGTVTINYYGMNAPTPAAGTTGFTTLGGPNATCPGNGCVPAGGQLVFTVGGGNGLIVSPTAGVSPIAQSLPAAQNFQGYIIAQSRFRYCHGFAFITCAGCGATAPGASESYLGLILDKGTVNRNTGNNGESLGN